MRTETRWAFLGSGNMAEALLRGLLGSGTPPSGVTMSDTSAERREAMARGYGVRTTPDNRTAAAGADAVVLAVKPGAAGAVLGEVAGAFPAGAVLLSVVAGWRTARIESRLGGTPRVIRAMPNTPALAGCGATVFCAGRWARPGDREAARSWLGRLGLALEIPEGAMDAATALSGCGPAYVCVLAEALLEAGTGMGLGEQTARDLVLQTIEGTARMLRATGEAPAEARGRVASKGGVTEAALGVLFDRKVPGAFREAVRTARDRSAACGG